MKHNHNRASTARYSYLAFLFSENIHLIIWWIRLYSGIFTTMKESVKIDSLILDRIRKHVKNTRQTIGGYIDIRLEECIQQDEKESRTFEEIGKLNKESNKKKK